MKAFYLTEEERIRLGSFYTPCFVVRLVRQLVEKRLVEERLKGRRVVVLDPACGLGAFFEEFVDVKGVELRGGDVDERALFYVKECFPSVKVFEVDVVQGVSRKSFDVPEDAFLVVVGNPPYNDVTSLYRKGKKGSFTFRSDLADRDVGVAFLKALVDLKPDVVAILHPFSYLCKQANFQRLKRFFDDFCLVKGLLFPSFWFEELRSKRTAFPIVVALYERGQTAFEDVLNFEFHVLPDRTSFKLSYFQTTDGLIPKYAKKKESSLGVYFYAFRDLNSLVRNADFVLKQSSQTLPVELEVLPRYCYLVSLKHFVVKRGVKNFWLFGNLSPLVDVSLFLKLEKAFTWYAYRRSKVLQKAFPPSLLSKFFPERLFPEAYEDEVVEEYFERVYAIKEVSREDKEVGFVSL